MGKILGWQTLKEEVDKKRAAGGKIVFTNGCFDILHIGHVNYLTAARRCGDVLVVGLNSDSSVRAIKGERKPLTPQEERAAIMAALVPVDYVTVFEETTPLRLIEFLKPDILVKGGDWKEEEVVGGEQVKKWGGHVVIIPYTQGASTTNIVERILSLYGEK